MNYWESKSHHKIAEETRISVENMKNNSTANTIVHIVWQEKMDIEEGKLLHTSLNQETKLQTWGQHQIWSYPWIQG